MVPADLRWRSDGRGGVRCGLDRGFPRRGCGGQRVARTHLTSFFFRAFRFATRCPGGRVGLYHTRPKAFRVPVGADALIGPLHQLPRGMASGSEKRSCSMRRPPRRPPHPRRGNQPSNVHRTPPRPSESHRELAGTISRRPPYSAEARRCRSATKGVLFFWTVHGPFSFRQDRKENGGCIAQLST